MNRVLHLFKLLVKRLLRLPGMVRITEAVIVQKYLRENDRSRKGERFRTPWIFELEDPDADRLIRYKDEVVSDYFRLSGLTKNSIIGKRILEIGPGSNLGVALELLIAGASQVVCADRFPSLFNMQLQLSIYRSIRERLNEGQQRDFDSIIELSSDSYTLNPERIQYQTNAPLETLSDSLAGKTFDFILSRAVLEHVFDLNSAIDSMDKLLAPGGYLLHEVDFRDHNMFTFLGLNPLTFLTVPNEVWKKMGSHIGAPNRCLIDFYERKLNSLGYISHFKTKHIFGSDMVIGKEKIQEGRDYGAKESAMICSVHSRLQPQFRSLPPEKLLVSVIFFTSCKTN